MAADKARECTRVALYSPRTYVIGFLVNAPTSMATALCAKSSSQVPQAHDGNARGFQKSNSLGNCCGMTVMESFSPLNLSNVTPSPTVSWTLFFGHVAAAPPRTWADADSSSLVKTRQTANCLPPSILFGCCAKMQQMMRQTVQQHKGYGNTCKRRSSP